MFNQLLNIKFQCLTYSFSIAVIAVLAVVVDPD
jgi:hypothetical protein